MSAITIVLLILFLLFLAFSKSVIMWMTGMDIAVKNQKRIIELLDEIAENTTREK